MGFIFGLLKRIIKFFLYIAGLVAVILLIPNLPPYTKFTSIELDATQPRTGALAPNGDLNNVEKLYIDKLLGPESFQLWNGELYTSLATGEIVKISHGGHVTFVTQIGQPCTGIAQEHICGRPLGFVFDDKSKQMYVADAYLGIWRVDLKSYKKQLLVSPRKEIEGRKPMLFNSVALAANGDLYWTDSTSDYNLKDGVFAIVSDPSGRLFRYNPAKNESTVLLDDLWFANGIVMSPDNQFVLISETNRLRVLKYYIDGPKKGSTEVFASGLPGTPDMIRNLPDGSGVLVSLYVSFDDEHPLLLKSLSSTPMARKFAARFMRLLELPFEFVNTHFPHTIFEQITYTIGHFATISGFGPDMSGIVQIDWNGNVVSSHYNTDRSIDHISDAIVYNDKLYLGCPHRQNFIGSVPVPPLLKKAFYDPKSAPKTPAPQKVKPAEEQKIVQKDKKPVADQPKQKVDKPAEQKPTQKTTTEKPPSSQGDKVKTTPPKQPEVKNTIPKAPVKPVVKEEAVKSTPKVTETKPKQQAAPESTKPKTKGTPKPATKAEATPEPKKVPVTKPKEAPKVEVKKETVQEQKVVPESKPNAAPKVEPKKEAPAKPNTVKSEKSDKEKNTPSTDKPASKAETPKATTPKQVKPEKKAKKPPVEDEPQIIVQRLTPEEKKARKPIEGEPQIIVKKVVPDEIPVNEEIPSDTMKPKGEPLKVIKKSGPIEIPTNV
ncbi:adipocyte plasma membrane-associated protein Hemomucin-like [Epargyreus clarus]|uniref:adipocyte plasma membrane-associated protein Hemomucin-like n=1 Tax=Epargyreus clarus TaxID=520877 RepID=UPI003C2AD90E